MKVNIDFKSALCGLVIGVVAIFALGAEAPFGGIGRYQISAAHDLGIILDTKTGQAWAFEPINTSQYRNDGDFWVRKDHQQ